MEILQNSILKLIIRQGADADRKSVILDSGELGYSVDTKRVFIGDSVLSGGNVVGNLYAGDAPTITDSSLWPSVPGDSAFSTDSNKLYVLKSNDGSTLSDWLLIGGVYSSGDSQINISSNNTITLAPLSANTISEDAIMAPLSLNAGRLTISQLSSNNISEDALTNRLKLTGGRLDINPISAYYISTDALSSPVMISDGKISLSPLSAYHISENAIDNNGLTISNGKIALSSTIPFQKVSTNTMTVGGGLNVTVNGTNSNNTAFNPLSSNIILESKTLLLKYNGLSAGGNVYSSGINFVTKNSTGHYTVTFINTLPTINYIAQAQIIGEDALGYFPRVLNPTTTTCDIKILNDSGSLTDANISLQINY